ncbi:MAG: hypothetical protein OXO48_05345 [Caldilineaceae bacterium]|nr:hypothetical protein [Caldilineaceae bacterium]
MSRAFIIEEDNLSVAWAKAFIRVVDAGEIAPFTVVIRGFVDGKPKEVAFIRQLIDDALGAEERPLSCHKVANTIFPTSLWNPRAKRQQLYERYLRIMPRVLRDRRNSYGVYFQRLIAFGHHRAQGDGFNQLEHIISIWNGGNRRRTAFQAAIFDPEKDHTNQTRRGFPCLQHVIFAQQGDEGLSVTGFYATQYIFERAYGNYLGLCRLGHFMAQEMGRRLTQVSCVASPAKRERTKKSMMDLVRKLEKMLNQTWEGQ